MTDVVDEREIDELALEVTHTAGRLAGSAEAAAVLGSMGVGDERARRLGRANMFRLAAEVAERQEHSPEALEARRETERERRDERLARSGGDVARPVGRSLALALALVAPALAIPLLTASLWTGGPPEAERATAIGLAVAASLVTVAGFVLAMAVVGRGHRTAAVTRPTLRVAGTGLAAAAAGGLALWAVLSWKDFVAPAEVGVTLQYFALLAVLWLAAGLAVAAGRTGWVLIAFAAGIGVGAGLRLGMGTSQVAAHRAGILTAAVLSAGAALTAARNGHRRVRTLAAPWSTVAMLVLLGTALGGMLFADRLATWYSQSPFHLWILQLRPDAEAGWDWALVAVLGVVAVTVAAARRFGGRVAGIADRSPLTAGRAMSDEVRTAYRRSVGLLVLAAAIGAAASFVAVVTLMAVWTPFADVVSRHTAYVFAIVGPGLVLLAWASFNAAILMTMQGRGRAVLAAWIGLLVDAAVALPLAAHADGWTAAAGLPAGALAFLVVTLFGIRRVLRNPDLAFATRG